MLLRNFLDWRRRKRRARDRQLFSFFDGQQTRRTDPMAVHIGLETHPEFEWGMGDLVDAGDSEATRIVHKAVCDVFGVHPWDPGTETGLTGAELLAILWEYTQFEEGLKKNTSGGPILREPTELEYSDSTEHQGEPMKPPTDSTSTATETSYARPHA